MRMSDWSSDVCSSDLATKMRRYVRHELHRDAEPEAGLLLVHVAGERVRHQVVAQLVRIVLVRRRGTGAGIAGDAKAHGRTGQQLLQRRDGKQIGRASSRARVVQYV